MNKVSEEYLTPTPIIESDHEDIVAFAAKTVKNCGGKETSSMKKCWKSDS